MSRIKAIIYSCCYYERQYAVEKATCSRKDNMQSKRLYAVEKAICSRKDYMQSKRQYAVKKRYIVQNTIL